MNDCNVSWCCWEQFGRSETSRSLTALFIAHWLSQVLSLAHKADGIVMDDDCCGFWVVVELEFTHWGFVQSFPNRMSSVPKAEKRLSLKWKRHRNTSSALAFPLWCRTEIHSTSWLRSDLLFLQSVIGWWVSGSNRWSSSSWAEQNLCVYAIIPSYRSSQIHDQMNDSL
jgi:hypothetical protein